MDIQEYISSGVIEAYVTGIADEREIREVEALSLSHPEVAAAIEDCRTALETYAGAHSVTPPPALKQSIWQAIQQEMPVTAPPAPAQDHRMSAGSNQQRSIPLMPWKYGVAASVILLAGSLAGNMYLMKERDTAAAQVSALEQQQKTLIQAKEQALLQQSASAEALSVLMNPDMKKVQLDGVGTHTANKAMIYWDSRSGDVFLSLQNLPVAPEGKQYQLWAIVDGKPVDAGMYDIAGGVDLHKMKTIARAEMFAITLEQKGGSPVPSMDQMMVAGKPG